ncbi:MAG: hypothetical protein GX235_01540 [Clostridiales bacterium]|nr:hypothetical protein [Clostridiales bacterium]
MDTAGLWPVIVICILNVLVAFGVFVWACFQKKGRRSTGFLAAWFIFIVPFLGLLYLLLGYLISFLNRKKAVDMSDVSFSQEREKLVLPPDQETELNYVPIQDAMEVSDTLSLRRLILDALRNDAKRTVASIAVAMNSRDTETSHYAASVILDALSEFRSTAQNMIEHTQKLPEDVEMNLLTFNYIHDVLKMKIMTNMEQEAYIYTLDNVAENLFTHNLWYMTATHYLWMTDWFLSLKDYNMADKWVSRASKYRPYVLDTFKARLHLYYNQHNQPAFFECLNELRESDVKADEEILNLFRLYGKQEYRSL